MVNLALSNSSDDILAELAAEFGIQAEQKSSPSFTSRKTYFSRVPKENPEVVRVLKGTWGSSNYLEWNAPGTETVEQFGRDFAYINEIEGYVIKAEIQATLNQENPDPNSKMPITVCSVTGYKNEEGVHVKGLPRIAPLQTMYKGWDPVANRPNLLSPHDNLAGLEWLGSRGKSCADCILAGESTKNAAGEEVGECKLRGRVFFYVTTLVNYFGGSREVRTVESLLGVPGFVLQLNLPTATGLKGKFDKAESDAVGKGQISLRDAKKLRQCYLPFATGILFKYRDKGASNSVFMHKALISIAKPGAEERQPKNYLTFEELPMADVHELRRALTVSKELFQKEEEILDASHWVINGVVGHNAGAITSRASVERVLAPSAAAVTREIPTVEVEEVAETSVSADGLPF